MASKRSIQRLLGLFADRCTLSCASTHQVVRDKLKQSFHFYTPSSFSQPRIQSPSCSRSFSILAVPDFLKRKSRLPPDLIPTIQELHPNLSVSTNSYDLESHGHGESYHPSSPPDAVIRPTSVEEIQDILRLCCREKRNEGDDVSTVEIVSIIPYGAGKDMMHHAIVLCLCFCAFFSSISFFNRYISRRSFAIPFP